MTQEITSRGPFDDAPGVTVRWMLKSGQRNVRQYGSSIQRTEVRDGIQLYVPTEGGKVAMVDMDVHEAGDLYQALEDHMENVAADGVRTLDPQERERLLRKHQEGVRIRNLKAVQDEIDRPWTPGEGGVDAEFLAAMEAVLAAWTSAGPVPNYHRKFQDELRVNWPTLASALDRLAALNA